MKPKEPKMIFFMRHASGYEVKMTLPGATHLLPEVLRQFEEFLKGCGYHFDGELDFVEDQVDSKDDRRDD